MMMTFYSGVFYLEQTIPICSLQMGIGRVNFGMIEISTNTLAEWVERQLLFDTGGFPEIKILTS